jgi:hypothetical protein
MDVKIGFTAPGSVEVTVENPENEQACLAAFVERIEELSEDELLDELETDGVWLAENVHFVDDAESGEIIHQW